jgi:dihydroorotase
MVPLLMAMVYDKKVSLDSLIQKIAYNPAIILGITPSGFLKGNRADFALFPRQRENQSR